MTPFIPARTALRALAHRPHKSVNQTSLTRCYWCLAATGSAAWVLATCKQAPLCYSRLDVYCASSRLMNRDSYYGNVSFRTDSIILKALAERPTARALSLSLTHSLRGVICEKYGYNARGERCAASFVNCCTPRAASSCLICPMYLRVYIYVCVFREFSVSPTGCQARISCCAILLFTTIYIMFSVFLISGKNRAGFVFSPYHLSVSCRGALRRRIFIAYVYYMYVYILLLL